jgi:tRNA pseudouridine38-40 synthase
VDLAQFALVIEYNGTQYHGSQWQVGVLTVQGEIEQALRKLCGETSRVMAASRTDAGVHARGQVVSFWTQKKLDTEAFVRGLNYYLPRDIAVKAAYEVSAEFNVRRDALSREYCYHILNRDSRSPFYEMFSWFIPTQLNIEAIGKACRLLEGRHDFISFCPSIEAGKSTMRYVYDAKVNRLEDLVVIKMKANSFLTHQVRSTVGLLTSLGLNKVSIGDFRDILEAKYAGLAKPVAPARGLCLTKVNYAKPLGGKN